MQARFLGASLNGMRCSPMLIRTSVDFDITVDSVKRPLGVVRSILNPKLTPPQKNKQTNKKSSSKIKKVRGLFTPASLACSQNTSQTWFCKR